MKTYKLLTIALLLCAPALHAEKVMSLITDTGRAIALSQVNCVLAIDGESTIAVQLNDGLTLSGISYATFGMSDDAGVTSAVAEGTEIALIDKSIVVSCAADGSAVNIYDAAGRSLLSSTVTGGTCTLDVSALIPGQCYIVSVNGKSLKFVKR